MTWNIPENPFVGLRPFEAEESLIFFGRDEQTRDLLQQLYTTRFLAVVGSSGCGKSSLIRAGLIPKLQAGFLVEERDAWRIAKMKPGDAPILNLAEALLNAIADGETRSDATEFAEAIRERGVQAIVEELATALDRNDANLLLLIDQFEELFRFGLDSDTGESSDEAADFVSLMLALAEQRELPIYVTMTMRSDFLKDCDAFIGLPEAMNRSQYLVPRLTRQQRRETIEGPIQLYRGDIVSALTDRLLNETGETRDDLPVLQHALMRCWAEANEQGSRRVDLEHYKAIGTVREALSRHAEEALQGMDEDARLLTKRIFQTLTETDAGNRRIRRPAKLDEIQAITGASRDDIWQIIQKFRSDDRSFLVVSSQNIADNPTIDISHESLIRQWERLKAWVDEEAESARTYRRLAQTAALHSNELASLYRGADLQVALDWREQTPPNVAWATRYEPEFDAAMRFLDASVEAWEQERARAEAVRQRELKQAQDLAAERQRRVEWQRRWITVLVVLLIIAVATAVFAFVQWERAESLDKDIAQKKIELAQLEKQVETQKEKAKKDIEDAETKLAEIEKSATERERVAQEKVDTAEEQLDELQTQLDTAKENAEAQTATAAQATTELNQAKVELERVKQAAAAAAEESRIALEKSADEKEKADQAVAQVQQQRDSLNAEIARLQQQSARQVADAQKQVAVAEQRANQLSQQADLAITQAEQERLRTTQLGAILQSRRLASDALENLEIDLELSILLAGEAADRLSGIPEEREGLTDARDEVVLALRRAIQAPPIRREFSPHKQGITGVAFSRDGTKLATTSRDGTAQIWRVNSKVAVPLLDMQHPHVTCVAFNSEDTRIATGAADGTVKVWDSTSDQEPATFNMAPQASILSLAFTSGDEGIAALRVDGTVQVWNITSGAVTHTVRLQTRNIKSGAFSSDGTRIATGGEDGKIRLWNATSGEQIGQALAVLGSPVLGVAFSPANTRIATSGARDGEVVVWDIDSRRRMASLRGARTPVYAVAFNRWGSRLAAGNGNGGVQIWDVTPGASEDLTAHMNPPTIENLILVAEKRLKREFTDSERQEYLIR